MRFAEWMLIVDATAMSDIMDHGHGDLILCVGYGSCCVWVWRGKSFSSTAGTSIRLYIHTK